MRFIEGGWWVWARARHIPESLVATVLISGVGWAAARGLRSVDGLAQAEGRAPLALWLPILMTVAWSSGLVSRTALVDETCARSSSWLRLCYLGVALMAGVAGLVAALPADPGVFGWGAAARTYVGCLGFAAVVGCWVPAGLLWLAPTTIGVVWGLASSPFLPTAAQTVLFGLNSPAGSSRPRASQIYLGPSR
ncbi:Uncharacterised protein [Dermatophilus congolensis]|uniref:Uncharacterized protein n=1 Tax=Dermatophilus congolensis TaxID=1863 RepID=A0AA46H1A3_9MICO|nr:hypothetical protein [Dermatophilus congolensis]STD14214.1 Uncharacterised protein [Dermatophilus congolensis]